MTGERPWQGLHLTIPTVRYISEYESRWRDITDSLLFGWTAEYAHIRRAGDSVTLRTMGLDGRESANLNCLGIPEGFVVRRSLMPGTALTSIKIGRVDETGLLSLGAAAQAATPTTYAPEHSSWRVPGLAKPTALPPSACQEQSIGPSLLH